MEPVQSQQYDVYTSDFQGKVVRCKECWHSMMVDGIADNNGYFPYHSYPHATWCSQSKT